MQELGPYQLLNEIARGGMGVVYRALDRRDGRIVALKVVLDMAGDLDMLERFRRETTLLQGIEHPNLVRVFEVSLAPPRPYAAFEFVEGGTLKERVEREGPLPWPAAVRLLAEVAAGVSAAHERNLLHRDIKPDNILLADSGAKLADFGLIKDLGQESLTQSGSTLGTPAYMAPEQVGAERERWGPTTDVYGLAATLYFALTGVAPFTGPTTIAVLHAVLQDAPAPPRGHVGTVPEWLEALCLRGLSKLNGDRFPHAIAFRAALRSGAAQVDSARGAGRRWLVGWAIAAAISVASVGVAIILRAAPLEASVRPLRASEKPVADTVPHLADEGDRVELPPAASRPSALDRSLQECMERAQAFREEGNNHRALQELEQACALSQDHLPAWLARVDVHRKLGDLSAALDAIDNALAISQDSHVLHKKRADLLREAGRNDEALASLNTYLQRASSPESYLDRIDLLSKLGRGRDALPDWDRVVALQPNEVDHYIHRALHRANFGSLKEAFEDCAKALALDALSSRAHSARAVAHYRSGDTKAAHADLARARELDSSNTHALGVLADIQSVEGRHAERVDTLQRIAALMPKSVQAHMRAANALKSQQRYAEATEALLRVSELEPNNPQSYLRLAQIYRQQRLFSQELAAAEAALACPQAALSSTAAAYTFCAMARRDLGDHDRAIEDFDRALALLTGAGAEQVRGLREATVKLRDGAR